MSTANRQAVGDGSSPSLTPTVTAAPGGAFSHPLDDSRFTPGTIIGERYRIVSLLGRGGMGEVYRADDLTLSVPVALKFLPEAIGIDPKKLERFRGELRIARQISHPNICRVFDVGEVDDQHFFSMEYIEGEDLASLLKRVGRLPVDRGLQVARELAVGLAAVHDKGIVHRDIKPANVMIDGQGRVRITDFGLAGLGEAIAREQVAAGTPAYMAPEQFAGFEVTTRSDLYSLGLVLYELFTGERAVSGTSLEDLRRAHESSAPVRPSAVVGDIDPVLERVILQCLEKDPRRRPSSALAVAAALLGGDPLQAAMAAGVTLSPELVAEAGEVGALSPRRALGLLVALVACTVAMLSIFLIERPSLLQQIPLPRSPQVLAEDARSVMRELATIEPSVHRSIGFRYGRQSADTPADSIYFWYRQGTEPMVPTVSSRISEDDPPALQPGMTSVRLTTTGRLISFRAIRPSLEPGSEASPTIDWYPWFERAELDGTLFDAVPSTWMPPLGGEETFAWQERSGSRGGSTLEVRAARSRDGPVYFAVAAADHWSRETAIGTPVRRQGRVRAFGLPFFQGWPYLLILIFLIFVIAVLVHHNLHLRRGDLRGSGRIAAFVFLVEALRWLFTASHAFGLEEELEMILVALPTLVAEALFFAATYLALEPYIRRIWPENLVGWSRLLAGRVRDPMVGRDVLVGTLGGVGLGLLKELLLVVPSWLGGPAVANTYTTASTLLGGRWLVDGMVQALGGGGLCTLTGVLCLTLLRLPIRRSWMASAASFLFLYLANLGLLWAFFRPFYLTYVTDLPLVALFTLVEVWVLVRYGLLASATMFSLFNWLSWQLPIVDGRLWEWTGDPFLLLLVVLTSLGTYGFLIGRRGRPWREPSTAGLDG